MKPYVYPRKKQQQTSMNEITELLKLVSEQQQHMSDLLKRFQGEGDSLIQQFEQVKLQTSEVLQLAEDKAVTWDSLPVTEPDVDMEDKALLAQKVT